MGVSVFAKSYEPCFASADGRCSQVARRADGGLLKFCLVERALLRLEREDLLAFSDVHLRCVREERVEVVGAESNFSGIDRLTDGCSGVLKERIGALAARSILAVVIPVDRCCHVRTK